MSLGNHFMQMSLFQKETAPRLSLWPFLRRQHSEWHFSFCFSVSKYEIDKKSGDQSQTFCVTSGLLHPIPGSPEEQVGWELTKIHSSCLCTKTMGWSSEMCFLMIFVTLKLCIWRKLALLLINMDEIQFRLLRLGSWEKSLYETWSPITWLPIPTASLSV